MDRSPPVVSPYSPWYRNTRSRSDLYPISSPAHLAVGHDGEPAVIDVIARQVRRDTVSGRDNVPGDAKHPGQNGFRDIGEMIADLHQRVVPTHIRRCHTQGC